MFYAVVTENTYLVRLTKGERTVESIKQFCLQKNIKNGWISAIGSIESPKVAHYRVDTKKYSEKVFDGIYEVTNLTGNIALFEKEPLVHIHVSLSDESMRAFGGHLVDATVSATLEIYIHSFTSEHTKLFSEEIGLKLWNLSEKI